MRTEYDVRLKTLRDNYSAEQYMIETSIKKGEEQKAVQIAKKMLSEGLSSDLISRVTGLTLEYIKGIQA